MNRRDFFKKIVGAVGVAALGGAASQQAQLVSGGFTITISNGIEPAEPLIDVSELYDLGQVSYSIGNCGDLNVYTVDAGPIG